MLVQMALEQNWKNNPQWTNRMENKVDQPYVFGCVRVWTGQNAQELPLCFLTD